MANTKQPVQLKKQKLEKKDPSNEQQKQAPEANNMQQGIEFKQVESRILGPLSISVKPKEGSQEAPKGVDLILPPVSFAMEARVYLQLDQDQLSSEEQNLENANPEAPVFHRVDQDLHSFLIPTQQGLRLSIKFEENFYQKYDRYINKPYSFNLMIYVLGFVDPELISEQLKEPNATADSQQS